MRLEYLTAAWVTAVKHKVEEPKAEIDAFCTVGYRVAYKARRWGYADAPAHFAKAAGGEAPEPIPRFGDKPRKPLRVLPVTAFTYMPLPANGQFLHDLAQAHRMRFNRATHHGPERIETLDACSYADIFAPEVLAMYEAVDAIFGRDGPVFGGGDADDATTMKMPWEAEKGVLLAGDEPSSDLAVLTAATEPMVGALAVCCIPRMERLHRSFKAADAAAVQAKLDAAFANVSEKDESPVDRALREFWEAVKPITSATPETEAARVVDRALLRLAHRGWRSQMPKMCTAAIADDFLRGVYLATDVKACAFMLRLHHAVVRPTLAAAGATLPPLHDVDFPQF